MTKHPIFPTAYEQSGVLTPGLPIMPHGVERHPIADGGSQAVKIEKGDEITILDREGLQPVEMVFFAHDGTSDSAMIGAKGGRSTKGLQDALGSEEGSGRKVLYALNKAGFDIGRGDCILLFPEGSKAGDTGTFHAGCDGLLIVCAVGHSMDPHTQSVPSEIIMYIRRANPKAQDDLQAPPEPLADQLQDYNILPGYAKSYEVKAGQYIQILDIQGRECSDFQAFSKRSLDAGLETGIDMTTTCSLTGTLYPGPGIHGKFFSVNQEPLCEVVQDTCGRHDVFGLACYPRLYEVAGYPGHVNCSANINTELSQYGMMPRAGWPAVNLFFNSLLDDHHSLLFDEPWSRPGDYVMMKALTDLVCVSTACPDDISAANAWNPTDIQVRVYDENEDFKRSIGWRKQTEGDLEHTKETGFHNCFSRHTRDFVEFNGYWLANTYTNHGTIAEYWAARKKAVIMDMSSLRKYEITGPDAEALMQMCVTRNIKKLSIGGIVYTAMCYENGGMIDDGTVFRLGQENFRWIGGCDASGQHLSDQVKKHGLNAWVKSSTEHHCNVAVQGPLSCNILKDLIWTSPEQATVEELEWFRLTIGRIGGFNGIPVVVSRTGYSGERGYEVFCHPNDAEKVFDAIWEVGAPMGMIPLGLQALDILRIEAGLVFAGHDFSDQTDPFEAGIGFTVPLKTQEDDFIGRAAIERRKENPMKKLVGLDLTGSIIPLHGDGIYIGRSQIGEITSAVKSPVLDKVIALARIDVSHADVGSKVEVGQLDGLQKRLQATIVPFAHYDPKKERVRGVAGV